jgi:hypothetical protein
MHSLPSGSTVIYGPPTRSIHGATVMPQEVFRKGYLDAWSSIRGNEPAPPVQPHSIELGEDPYRAGVARAVREAGAKALGNARRVGRWTCPVFVDG